MSDQIKLALVGLGTIARNQHLPSIAATDGITLTAIASRNAQEAGLANYTDIDALLEAEDVQAVSLCTPPQGRFAQAASVIAAGRHVMLEKPPGVGVSEIHALHRLALAKGVTLFTTWHSREAAVVETARAMLADAEILQVDIDWREDVRQWHPGQQWIWQAGGLGVFDPGINALSILTRIIPDPVFVTDAQLEVPENCQTPIAATVQMSAGGRAQVSAAFDWRWQGPPQWDIAVQTTAGTITLKKGGAELWLDGTLHSASEDHEYRRLYARFVDLIGRGESDVDVTPLQLVADAFLVGSRTMVEPFYD